MAINLKLGDKLEYLIEAIVPNAIITEIQKKDGGCGCAKRKATLNKLDELF